MAAKIGPYSYTGRYGPGVIPKFREGRVVSETQTELFCSYDPSTAGKIPNCMFPSPIAVAGRPRRGKSRKTPLLAGLFPELPEVIAAPIPGIANIPLPDERPVIRTIKLATGGEIPVPEDLESLISISGLQFVRKDDLFYDREQARALTIMTMTGGNLAFYAETGFGKTIVQLMFIDWAISRGQRAIVFVPFDNLVEQFQRDAELFFDFTDGALLFCSGQSHAPVERQAMYRSEKPFCLVTTPEAFLHDIECHRLDPRVFQYRLYDEIHLALGDYAHVQVEQTLKPLGGRVFGFTGTWPDDDATRTYIIDTFGLRDESGLDLIHRLHAEPAPKFTKPIFTRPDDELLRAAEILYTGAARAAYETANVLRAAIRTESGLLSEASLLESFERLARIHKDSFQLPPFKELQQFRERLTALCQKDRKRYWRSYSTFCEFEHISGLYTTLVCFGKFAFLQTVADNLWALALPGARPRNRATKKYRLEKRAFIKRACANRLVVEAFSLLSAGSTFNVLLNPSVSLNLVWLKLPEDIRKAFAARPEPRKVHKLFFEAVTEEFVCRNYVDHPNEARSVELLRRHLTFGYRDQILVYANLGKFAPFLARRFAYQLGAIGGRIASFVGRKHATHRQRKGVIAEFQKQGTQVLTGTDAISVGLDSHAAVLLCWSQSARWQDRAQLEGRVGRKKKPGLIYNLVLPGTRDAIRYYRGLKNMRKARFKNARLKE